MPSYDYIIAGAGAAGLSLLTRMISSSNFSEKKFLVIDRAPKRSNDRTWCFWEKDTGFFEEIVYRKWKRLSFHSLQFNAELSIEPYQYKMIRGIDFYNWCFDKINRQKNIEIVYGELSFRTDSSGNNKIFLDSSELNTNGAIVFNSIHHFRKQNNKTIDLLQHFKGWIIETDDILFDGSIATLMDFRISQADGSTFVYVMPFGPSKALVEYTLFSENILEQHQYDTAIRNYIKDFLGIEHFRIVEEEFGIIPMTNARFPFYENGMYNIGTAGGQTKASTGYTFHFIQKQTSMIVNSLANNKPLQELVFSPARFSFYDSVLLQVLQNGKPGGREVFSRLFQRNKAAGIFKFLDNETSLLEELRLMSSLPIAPFFKAAMQQLV